MPFPFSCCRPCWCCCKLDVRDGDSTRRKLQVYTDMKEEFENKYMIDTNYVSNIYINVLLSFLRAFSWAK